MIEISYQTVSISGTTEGIRAEARRLYGHLTIPEGGFIGYVEEYGVMGMSEENCRAYGQAFRKLGPAQKCPNRRLYEPACGRSKSRASALPRTMFLSATTR